MRCLSLTRFVLSLAAALLAVGVCAPRAQASFILNKPSALGLNNGLVGWWTFDGKDMAGNYAFDKSGNGNRGTLTGTNGLPVRTIGKIGQGLSFDGVDDSVDIPPTPAFVDNTTGSVSLWFNTKSFTAEQTFADVLFVSDPDEFRIEYLGDSNDQLRVVVVNNAAATAALDTANNTITDSNWHHLVVTSDGSVLRLFLDGAQKTLTAAVGSNTGQWFASAVDANRLNLGSQNGASSLLGSLDDVRVYTRALSADEIKRLYNIGGTVKLNSTLPGPQSGLVGWWTFDGKDMAGNYAFDKSGNGNRGTLTGTNGIPQRTIGKIGQALSFDGVDDYVNVSSGASLKGKSAATISLWYKPSGAPPGDAAMYYESTATTGNSRFSVQHRPNGDLRVVMRDTDGGTSFTALETAAFPTMGQWHHIVATVDAATDNLILYRNGAQVAIDTTAKGSFTAGAPADTIAIGAYHGGVSIYNNGLIDDVRLYTRALSADEIKRLYNMGR